MRRLTVVLLVVFFLASVLGAAAPAQANDDRRGPKRGRFVERDYRRGQFAARGYSGGYSTGHQRGVVDWRGRDAYDRYGRGALGGGWRDPYIGYGRDRYRHDYYYGRPRGYFDGYRPSRFIVVPRHLVAVYPEYVTVVQPVVYDDVVLLPRYRYRVLERHQDQFLLIFGTGNLTVILRG